MTLARAMFEAAIGAAERVLVDHVRAELAPMIAAEVERQLEDRAIDQHIEISGSPIMAFEVPRAVAQALRQLDDIESQAKAHNEAGATQTAAVECVSRTAAETSAAVGHEQTLGDEPGPVIKDVLTPAAEPEPPEHDPGADPDLDRPVPDLVPIDAGGAAPPIMVAPASFLEEIEAFLVAHKMAVSTFGKRAANNLSFVQNMRAGKETSAINRERARKFMRDHARKHPRIAPAGIPTADSASGCDGSAPEGSSDAAGASHAFIANADQSRAFSKHDVLREVDLSTVPSAMDRMFANGRPALTSGGIGATIAAGSDPVAARCRCGVPALAKFYDGCIEVDCPGKLRA